MNEEAAKACDQADAFAKMWSDFAMNLAAAGLSFGPEASAPEAARQTRDALFQAVEQYWIALMRSPQFLEAMKRSLDTAVAFRKQVNEFLTRARHEALGPAREDIDAIMLCVRHMETRMLDRIDELAGRVDRISERLDGAAGHRREAREPGSAEPTATPRAGRSHGKRTKK